MFRKKSIFETWGRSVFDSFIKFYSDRDSDWEEQHLSPSTTYIHFANEKLPVCQWTDHYPNCDGENDRWSWKSIGYHVLSFDLSTHSVQLQLFDGANER